LLGIPIKKRSILWIEIDGLNRGTKLRAVSKVPSVRSSSMQTPLTFVVATNNREILKNNFQASPCFLESSPHQILIQEGFASAAKAYNDAINKSENDLIIFVHQDVVLPREWIEDLERALNYLDKDDPRWGVIGCYGEPLHGHGRGYIYSTGLNILGAPFERPARIQTLDEIVLIFRKSTALRFDDTLPNFHMYGADICMAAESAGRKNYAISAFCIHNTQPTLTLGADFYQAYRHVKRRWRKLLPIRTTCVRITRFDVSMFRRRLGEMYIRYIHWKEFGGTRSKDVPQLLHDVDRMLKQRSAGPGPTEIVRETIR
jgi:Glycosyltransferase like family